MHRKTNGTKLPQNQFWEFLEFLVIFSEEYERARLVVPEGVDVAAHFEAQMREVLALIEAAGGEEGAQGVQKVAAVAGGLVVLCDDQCEGAHHVRHHAHVDQHVHLENAAFVGGARAQLLLT